MRRTTAAIAATLTLTIATAAYAHTDTELTDWQADWTVRAGPALTPALVDEWQDMTDRHPCRIVTCPPRIVSAARIPASAAEGLPAVHAWTVEQWRPLVVSYWPADLVEWALRIIACESGGNPNAKNARSSAAGLFQFLRSTWDRGPAPALGFGTYDSGAVYDPAANIAAAAWLYQNWGGASQWSCKA